MLCPQALLPIEVLHRKRRRWCAATSAALTLLCCSSPTCSQAASDKLAVVHAAGGASRKEAVENRIIPEVTVTPSVVQAGVTSTVLVSIVNQNRECDQELQPGDAFAFDFNLGDGQIESFSETVSVTSKTLLAIDFTVAAGEHPSQIVLRYLGPAANFAWQEMIAFSINGENYSCKIHTQTLIFSG